MYPGGWCGGWAHTIPYYHIQIIPKRANAKPYSTITPQITVNVYHTPLYLESACLEQEPAQNHIIPCRSYHIIQITKHPIPQHTPSGHIKPYQ
jgi:hypothetical protein